MLSQIWESSVLTLFIGRNDVSITMFDIFIKHYFYIILSNENIHHALGKRLCDFW